jgi:NRPS condensation-like uncharacterized protein
MTAENAAGPQRKAEALRGLSPFERLFDAIDQTNGFNFSIAVCFRGKVAHSDWAAALAKAQQRHPFLNGSLNRDDAQAPYIRHAEGSRIPLAFERRDSAVQWQSVMEAQAEEAFGASAAPLVRVNILEDDHGCDLVVTAHHTILDGIGALLLISDVLSILSGKQPAPLGIPPAAEDRIAGARSAGAARCTMDPQAAEAWEKFLATRPPRSFERHKGTRRPVISSLRLSPDETGQLLGCARRQQTTLGAVLLTALATAVRRLNPSLTESDIHFSIPVDARPYLKNGEDFVLSITNPQGVCLYSGTGFWEDTRALRPQLAAFQSLDAIEAYFEAVKAVMDLKLETNTLVDAVAQKHGVDITLTNLKRVEFPVLPEGLTVEAVWGPSVSSPVAGGIVLGAATYNGALHLVCTTYRALPELPGVLCEILATACRDA